MGFMAIHKGNDGWGTGLQPEKSPLPPFSKGGLGGILPWFPGSSLHSCDEDLEIRMTSRRGFTIVEFIVAILILSLVIVAAISFFIYQSGYGRDASKKRDVRETVALALLMIRQDIMHASYGVADKPQTGLYLKNPTSPRRPTATRTENSMSITEDTFRPSYSVTPNVFSSSGYFFMAGGSNWISSLGTYDIGCFLSDTPDVRDYDRPVAAIGTNYQYTLEAGAPNANYAPGISYKIQRNAAAEIIALLRNEQVILGAE